MPSQLSSFRQLEKRLSQNIKALYDEEINFSPQKITCKLFSRYLAVVSDEALTPLEKSLWGFGKKNLSEEIRFEIDNIIKPKLIRVIESIVEVKVEAVLSNAAFTLNKCGILIIFEEPPHVSNFSNLSKTLSSLP
ncbi:MAG: Na-translocating system protein MpsC family protein [Cyanobacteria bacterium J06621_8]